MPIILELNLYPKKITILFKTLKIILPPSQNKCLNFILALVQICTMLKTFILGQWEYYALIHPYIKRVFDCLHRFLLCILVLVGPD